MVNKVLLIPSRYERKKKIQIRGKRYDCVFTAILLFDFVQFSKFLKIEKNKIQIRKINTRAITRDRNFYQELFRKMESFHPNQRPITSMITLSSFRHILIPPSKAMVR